MSYEEEQQGRAWILQELYAQAAARGLTVTSVVWHETAKGFDEGYVLLLVETIAVANGFE